ncbi:MAG TPA: type II toxin-antitoxin system VapC family toxin [Allosphingosinicella sp.]|jgi:PIN domain nuclease of toxin-antitoxin system
MRVLLDTHIAVWAMQNSSRLSETARDLLGASETHVFVSAVSIWEITIKHALGRGPPSGIDFSGQEAINFLDSSGVDFLAVTKEHAARVGTLPSIHNDPFDRLLVAQALHEPLRLVTHDKRVASYSNSFLLV